MEVAVKQGGEGYWVFSEGGETEVYGDGDGVSGWSRDLRCNCFRFFCILLHIISLNGGELDVGFFQVKGEILVQL